MFVIIKEEVYQINHSLINNCVFLVKFNYLMHQVCLIVYFLGASDNYFRVIVGVMEKTLECIHCVVIEIL